MCVATLPSMNENILYLSVISLTEWGLIIPVSVDQLFLVD